MGSRPSDSLKIFCFFRKVCCFSSLTCSWNPEVQVVWTMVSQAACTEAVGMVGVSDNGWVERGKGWKRVVCVKKKAVLPPLMFSCYISQWQLYVITGICVCASSLSNYIWRIMINSLDFGVKQTWIWVQPLNLRYLTSVFCDTYG